MRKFLYLKKTGLLLVFIWIVFYPSSIKITKNIIKEILFFPIKLVKPIPDKCWLHRVDSIEKMLELSDKYTGIEIDVNFDNTKLFFDVTHEIEDSISLSLEEYFKYLNKNDKKIWIDFKNLTEENVENSLEVLENIIYEYNVDKTRFIIESSNYKMLKSFKEKGYYTSYYVPYLDIDNLSEEELKYWKNKIKYITLTGNVSAISFPGYLYPFIKNIGIKADLLTWEDGKEWEILYLTKMTRNMLKDEKLKVILIRELGNYSR